MTMPFTVSVRFFVYLVIAGGLFVGTSIAGTVTIAAGSGTLTFTQTITTTTQHCIGGGTAPRTVYRNSSFSYKDASGTVVPLGGYDTYIDDGCLGTGSGGTATLTSTTLNVAYDNLSDPDGEVTGFQPHGYINPKYAIWGITYAPPGNQSFVDYTNSTALSSTVDSKSSFSNQFQSSITTKLNATIGGWSGGAQTTMTTGYTQSSYTSSSTTVSEATSLAEKTLGPSNPYVGIDHDYDVIWLLLNPVQLFTLIEDTSFNIQQVQSNGFGFSTLDPTNNMDIYPVFVGWLNGDITIPQNVATVLQRSWAAGESWPAGQGPGLTQTDYQNIEKADPYWQCTPMPSACPTMVDGTRYTSTLNQPLIFQQAPVGGQPITNSYTANYTQASTQGQGASYAYSQGFGWETTFGYSGPLSHFKVGYTTTLSQATTLTWTHMWDRSLTSTNTSSAQVSITGPPCVVMGGVCNPLYTGPTEFDVYEDNLYGTFLSFPIN